MSFASTYSMLAKRAARLSGRPATFALALLVIVIWAITGPVFGFSDTWQLIINTGTTIVTFLMVFLIQNTQNRDAKAIHLKLDELIRAISKARTELVDLEDLSEDELERLQAEFQELHNQYAQRVEQVKQIHGRRKRSTAKK